MFAQHKNAFKNPTERMEIFADPSGFTLLTEKHSDIDPQSFQRDYKLQINIPWFFVSLLHSAIHFTEPVTFFC